MNRKNAKPQSKSAENGATTSRLKFAFVKRVVTHSFAGVGVIALAVTTFTLGISSYTIAEPQQEGAAHEAHSHDGFFSRVFKTYGAAWIRVQAEVDELRRDDEENRKLKMENAHLRLVLESRRFECYAERAEKTTHEFEHKLSQETLSRTGRTLASIAYKIPTDLMPKELYSLGLQYFRTREDEKAAVIFTFLTGMEEEETFKTPANLLLTGIAWYRLEHFEKADFYFDQTIKTSETSGQARTGDQARLWKGLVSERTGKHGKAQDWLRQVLDRDPHSTEAEWINVMDEQKQEGGPKRATASEAHHHEE